MATADIRRTLIWGVIVVLACTNSLCSEVAGQTKVPSVQQQIKEAQDSLGQFATSGSLDHLQAALRVLAGVEVPATSSFPQDRQQVTRTWMVFLHQVDHSYDPTFDPAEQPLLNIIPPRGKDGRTYPSGIRPEDIPDREVRAHYEQQIKENNIKVEKSGRYWRLRSLDSEALTVFGNFLRHYYKGTAADKEELKKLADDERVAPATYEQILAELASK
jgi:hypothetical protein